MAAVIQLNFGAVDINALNLGLLGIDPDELGRLLQPFIHQASQLHRLAPADIDIVMLNGTVPPTPITFTWLINQGNPFFNAIFYLAMPTGDRPQIVELPQAPPAVTPQLIVSSLFVQWFFIITRGSTSEAPANTVGAIVPNFLANVLGLNRPPLEYARALATFNLARINPEWASRIDFQGLGRECVSRLGLGVAGYRALNPFRFIPAPNPMPANLITPYNVAMSFVNAHVSWDFHSATRNPQILATYGPLNANLGNLALDLFPQASLDELVATRQIFARPTRQPQARNYLTWTQLYTPPANRDIFP